MNTANVIDLLAGAAGWAFGLFGGAAALVVGAGLCLLAVQMVIAQPRAERDHAGITPQGMGLLIATPMAIAGLSLVLWVFYARAA